MDGKKRTTNKTHTQTQCAEANIDVKKTTTTYNNNNNNNKQQQWIRQRQFVVSSGL